MAAESELLHALHDAGMIEGTAGEARENDGFLV